MSKNLAIQQCIDIFGNGRTLAKAVGVTPSCVNFWLHNVRVPSIENTVKLWRKTKHQCKLNGISETNVPTLNVLNPNFDWKILDI